MLAGGAQLLTDARRRGEAVAAFTTYTLESTLAICEAGAAAGKPVILQAGSSSFRGVGRTLLAASALAMARESPIPVGVHLDHATDLGEIRACIALGYTSVMVDGSALGFEENVQLTRIVVDAARTAGVWVEAELGAIPGDENVSANAVASELTSPERASEFVERTGVDALAVAIGNVHGMTEGRVRLDIDLLSRIASVVEIPLVLHGASGLEDADLRRAVLNGVAKVNFNAELRRSYLQVLRENASDKGDDVVGLQVRAVKGIAAVASEKIRLLSADRKKADL